MSSPRVRNRATTRTTGKRPKNRKSTIVDAAAELFAERGYSEVGVNVIADRVAITGPGIYRHFRSKEEVLDAVLRLAVDRSNSVAAEAMSLPGEPADTVRRLVQATVQLAVDYPAHLASYFRERQVHSDRQPDDQLAAAENALADAWHTAIARATPQLSRAQIAARRGAAEGAIGALAALSHRRPQPAGPAFCDSVSSILLAPAPRKSTASRERPATRRTWVAQRSRESDILAASMSLFRRRGFSEVGMEDVGSQLGIAASTIYSYYPGKTDILMDAYDRVIAQLLVSVESSLDSAVSAIDALHRLVRSYVRLASDNVDLVVVTTREFHAVPAEERPRIRRRRRYFRESWAAVLQQVRPDLSGADAQLLAACALPLISHMLVQPDRLRTSDDELTNTVLTFLLGGPPAEVCS